MKVIWVRPSSPDPVPPALSGIHELQAADEPRFALGLLRTGVYDAVVAQFPIANWSAAEFVDEAARIDAAVPVVVLSAQPAPGAFQTLPQDASPDLTGYWLDLALDTRRTGQLAERLTACAVETWRAALVGRSPAMDEIASLIRMVGPRRSTVLVTGETGTGKELIARALHLASPRAGRPMVSVNCSALPEPLLEAELFGHVRGAFTGAVQNRSGRFEEAHRSTLFLDEIGDLPLDTQAKLLRVLQQREFQKVGSSQTLQVDVRVIAATNADLPALIERREFRDDLYYRLSVVPIHLPPLRERLADVPLLADHFIEKICRDEGLAARRLAPETVAALCDYSWPGNVRQLENTLERALVLSGDRGVLLPSDLRLPRATARPVEAPPQQWTALPDDGLDFEATVQRLERSLLHQALRRTQGNKKRAAEILRLKRTTLNAKLKALEAEPQHFAAAW